MTSDFNNENAFIKSSIWNSLELIRFNSKTKDFHFVLFVITLKKIGFTSNYLIVNEKSSDIIHTYLSQNIERFDLRFFDILEFYKLPIDALDFATFKKILELFENIDQDVFKESILVLFDFLLHKIISNVEKYSGEFILPKTISDLMLSLANIDSLSKVYNPFAGAASFGITPLDFNYVGQEINMRTWTIALMRLIVSDSDLNKQVLLGDSINQWNPTNDKFDVVVASPPFNMSLQTRVEGKWGVISKIESYFIEKALDSLNENGKVIVIVPEGFLTAKTITSNLRQHLIQSDLVEMIISLPTGIFSNTAIKTSILVLNKAKKVKGFVDFVLSDAFVKKEGRLNILDNKSLHNELSNNNSKSIKRIDLETIKNQEYLLNVKRYFLDNIKGVKLNLLLNTIQGKRITDEITAKVVSINDLTGTILSTSSLEKRSQYNKTFFRIIDESCLLISPSSNFLKACYFEYTGEVILVKHNIKAFTIDKDKVDFIYLINQFKENYLVKQVEAFSIGSIVPILNTSDILNLEIYLPSLLKQKEWVNNFYLKSLESEKDKVEFLRKQFNEELGSKQHNIRQHLKNVKDSFDVLIQFMDKKNGILRKEDIISPTRGITVEKRFDKLYSSLQNVIFEVNNLTNEQNFGNKENLDLTEIVKETIDEHIASNYEIETSIDTLALGELKDTKFIVQFAKNALKELINNVIENAVNHGFNNNKSQYKILFHIGFEENKIILKVLNNGLPFPKEVTKSFGIKGVKAGEKGNKGIGVWKIIQAVTHFGQEYKIIDEPKNEFPAGWIFKFNVIN